MQRRPLLALGAAALAAPWPLRAQEATPLVLGWGPFPDVPQIALASDKRLWAANRLETKIVPFPNGRAGFEALIGGQLDYVVMTEFPAVPGALRNLRFAIVAVLSQYRSFRLITRGEQAPADLRAFAGRRIAMPLGTNVHFVISDALEARGVSASLVNVPPPEMPAALARGDVDAIMTFPSGYQSARKALGAQYQELRLPDYLSSFVLAASEKSAANTVLTRRVLETLLQGEALLAKDAAEAQAATARYVGGAVGLDAIRAAWSEYGYRIKLDAGTLELMVREGRWLQAKGLFKDGEPSPALYRGVFAPEALRAIDPSRVSLTP